MKNDIKIEIWEIKNWSPFRTMHSRGQSQPLTFWKKTRNYYDHKRLQVSKQNVP